MSKMGRPKVLGEADFPLLREIARSHPTATLAELTEKVIERTGRSVHKATLHKALKAAGIIRATPVIQPSAEENEKRYGYNDRHRTQLPEQKYPSCLTDEEWKLVSDLFEPERTRGVPPTESRRHMVNAICYVVRTGCSWRMLPKDFPHWDNVYKTFRRWSDQGKFEKMHDRLRGQWREREGRSNTPTAAVLDSQSTRSSPQGGEKGFDAGKKVKGRKRHIVVDTLGLLLAVTVTAASVQDRDGAHEPTAIAVTKYPSLKKLYVDGGYAGKSAQIIENKHNLDIEVVRHPANKNGGRWQEKGQGELFPIAADQAGFVVLPKRWVVERTHGWNERARRLIMHHDRLSAVSVAWVWLAEARLLLGRLAR